MKNQWAPRVRHRASRTSRHYSHGRSADRCGAILVWFAISLTLLLGMVGLVVDSGYLMAWHRHLQSATDAAALAAADDLLRGRSESDVSLTAMDYLQLRNGLGGAFGIVNLPPQAGPYSGQTGYVEVVSQHSLDTYFIHILPGTDPTQTIRARAVAGYENVPITDGILLLDPGARPGLSVTGNAKLSVNGRIAINSEGGGLDESGQPVDNGNDGLGAFVSRFSSVQATEVSVVGGVNRPEGFVNYIPGNPNPLATGQFPVPDPLRNLATPTIDNGVVNVDRGAPRATPSGMELNNPDDDSTSPNFVYDDAGTEVMVLHPGIYSSITITSGRVEFRPGIYVLRPADDARYTLRMAGGDVTAQGVMFYNTGDNYDAVTGQPDKSDGQQSPPPSDGAQFGEMRIDSTIRFSPIDTTRFNYADVSPAIAQFNGLLFYQRRTNSERIQIQGISDASTMSGAIYAKSSLVRMPARGTFQSQFIAGSLQLPGHADVNIQIDPTTTLRTQKIFLVE